jgi:zinc D-Ala-D-Ala carboxypeptidase
MIVLSPNFTVEEFTISREAAIRRIDNTPSEEILKNLKILALKMEEIRELLGNVPLVVTSGYRSPDLNRIVGGASNSQHLQGLACDFICPKFGSPYDICVAIRDSKILYDQLIHEYGRWCHIGFANSGTKKEDLTICGPRLGYRRGILRC